jgi:hypothetical protein
MRSVGDLLPGGAPAARRGPFHLPVMHPAIPDAAPAKRRRRAGLAGVWPRVLMAALALVLLAVGVLAPPARADTIHVRAAELHTEEDGYYLNAEFEFAINATLEEALRKGIPLYFVLELELTRPRWYWLDEKALQYSFQYRIAYTPLTQQYRVSSGLLGQAFQSLDEVQRFLSRVTSRQVARRDQLVEGVRYDAALRLRLDGNQLPKPFQVNALTSREWSLQSDWHRWSVVP